MISATSAPGIPHINVDSNRGSDSSYDSFGNQEHADGQQLEPHEWNDRRSSNSDSISRDESFAGGNLGPRSNTMSRSGTVKKSINRYVLFILCQN